MTTTCALCRLALWRADIFSANKRPQKKWERERLKILQALQRMGVSQLELGFLCPHFMGISNVRERLCERASASMWVSIFVCVCRTIFFPFIGDCGVCGKMSVAHFHTPIVFQWACRCGGYSPWPRFHHTLCVCEGRNGSSCGFFIFHVSIQ